PSQSQRIQQGPRAGYFSEDLRPAMQIPTIPPSRAQETQSHNQQQNVTAPLDLGRSEGTQHQNVAFHSAAPHAQELQESLRYTSISQPTAFVQQALFQQTTISHPAPLPQSHSGPATRTVNSSAAASPPHCLPMQELDPLTIARNDSLGQEKLPNF